VRDVFVFARVFCVVILCDLRRYGCSSALQFNHWAMGGAGSERLSCDNGLVLEVSQVGNMLFVNDTAAAAAAAAADRAQVEDDPLRLVASDHTLLNSRVLNSLSPHFHVALGQVSP
jgi:hypothetical protein